MEPRLFGRAAAEQALAEAIDRHRASPLALTTERRSLGPYRGYAEMLAALSELWHRGARLDVIGKSVKGEPIFALEIGRRDAKRSTAVLSGIHPMEWIGIETHLLLLDHLLEHPPTDRKIVSVVITNPDGVVKVESNLRRTRRRFVRHNARRVDLNRNFPSFWGKQSLARFLLRRLFAFGSGPASEPEVRAITQLYKGTMVDRAVSLHSFGGAVLYPWGGLLRPPMDVFELRRWAKQVARRADPHRPYRAVQSSHWVPGFTAPGMELDWFYDKHGALSLLVECSRGGLKDPFKLGKLAEPFAWFNPARPDRSAPHIAAAIEPFVRGVAKPGG
jgi:Zinc carboxypeptidase